MVQKINYYPFGKAHTKVADTINRYLYNGKEMQDSSSFYDYGARYYNPDIGRFLTIDRYAEKYYMLTPYQYAANNPIKYIDVNGDSIQINFNNSNYLYQDGKLYNSDGKEYKGKVTGFLKQSLSALNKIGESKIGGSLLKELQGSKNSFKIERSDKSGFTSSDYMKAHAKEESSNEIGGSGGTINWNPKGTDLFTAEGLVSNPISDLAHELFHGQDAENGNLNKSQIEGIKFSEWKATYNENIFRKQIGLPYREFYKIQYNIETGIFSPLPPRLLDINNNPILPQKP